MLLAKNDLQNKAVKISDTSYNQIKYNLEMRPTSYDVNNVTSFSLMIPNSSVISDLSVDIVSEDNDCWNIIYRSSTTGQVEIYNTLSFSNITKRVGSIYCSIPFGVCFCPKYINENPLMDEYSKSVLFIQYTIDGTLFSVELDLFGRVIDYDTHLPEQLEVFGLEVDNRMYESFKDTEINQPYKDRKILNQKRRELLIRQHQIKSFQGTYKSLFNVLDFFGYGELLEIRELWINADKFISTEVTNEVLDSIDNRLAGFTKTNNLQLVYQINAPDGTVDDDGIPYYVNVLIDTCLVLYKLFLIRDILEEDFLPFNIKISDVVGEYTQPIKLQTSTWNNPTYCQTIQGSGAKDNSYIKVEDSNLVISNRFVLTEEGVFTDYFPNNDPKDRTDFVLGVNTFKQLVAYFLEDGRQRVLVSEWHYTSNIAFDLNERMVFTVQKTSDVDWLYQLTSIDLNTNEVLKSDLSISFEPNNLCFHNGLLYTINSSSLYTIDPNNASVINLGAINWSVNPVGELDLSIDSINSDVFVSSGSTLYFFNLSDLNDIKSIEVDVDNVTGISVLYNVINTQSERLVFSANTKEYNSSLYEMDITDILGASDSDFLNTRATKFINMPVIIKDLASYGFDRYNEPLVVDRIETIDNFYALETGTSNELSLLDENLGRGVLGVSVPIQTNSYIDADGGFIYSINSSQELEIYDLETQTIQSVTQIIGLPNESFNSISFYQGHLFLVSEYMYHIKIGGIEAERYDTNLNLLYGSDSTFCIWIDSTLSRVYIANGTNVYMHEFNYNELSVSSDYEQYSSTENILSLTGKHSNGESLLYFVSNDDSLYNFELSTEITSLLYTYAQPVFSLNLFQLVEYRPKKAFCYDDTDFLFIESEVFEDLDEQGSTIQPYEDYKMLNNFHSLDIALLKVELGFEPEEYTSFDLKIFNTVDLISENFNILPTPIWNSEIRPIGSLKSEIVLGFFKIGDYSVRFTLQDKHGGVTVLQEDCIVSTSPPDFSLCLIDRSSINYYTKEYQYNKKRVQDLDIHNIQTFHRGDIISQRDNVDPTIINFNKEQLQSIGFQDDSIATDPLLKISNLGKVGNIGSNPFENYTTLWGAFPSSEGYPFFTWTDDDLDINEYPLVNATSPTSIHVKSLMHKSPDSYQRETHIGKFSLIPMIDIRDSRMDDYGYSYPRWYIDILGDGMDGIKEFSISLYGLDGTFSATYTTASQTHIEFVANAVNVLNNSTNNLLKMFTFALEYVNRDDINVEVMIRATFRFKGYKSDWFVFTSTHDVIVDDYQSYGSLQGFSRTPINTTINSGTLTIQAVDETILGLEIEQDKYLIYSGTVSYTDVYDLATKLRGVSTDNNFDLEVIVTESDEIHLITKDNLIIDHPCFGTQAIKCIGLEGVVLNVEPVGTHVQMGQPIYAFVNTYSRKTDAFIVWELKNSLTNEIAVTQHSICFRYMIFERGTYDLSVSITDKNGTHTKTKRGFITVGRGETINRVSDITARN